MLHRAFSTPNKGSVGISLYLLLMNTNSVKPLIYIHLDLFKNWLCTVILIFKPRQEDFQAFLYWFSNFNVHKEFSILAVMLLAAYF